MRYNEGMVERVRKHHLGGWICLIILVIVAIGVALNREWLYDFYRGVIYQPSAEMARIRSDLKLTDRGEFLFNAAQPELDGAAEFNSHCRDGDSNTAVLGCYTTGNIYVYDIQDARLNGIRELTTAHELLHANWARMSEDEKVALVEPLTRTFDANQDRLGDEINTYDVSQKQEELYVRAGTEIANLPEVLEKHYAEIFKDQDAVVAYYDAYISVFNELRTEMDGLKTEMDALQVEIENKMNDYKTRVDQLNADIVSFNSCATVSGCFKTDYEFSTRRAQLMTEQEALGVMYEEINGLIADYNVKVKIYNADVSKSENLNTIINSAAKPQEIKQEEYEQ